MQTVTKFFYENRAQKRTELEWSIRSKIPSWEKHSRRLGIVDYLQVSTGVSVCKLPTPVSLLFSITNSGLLGHTGLYIENLRLKEENAELRAENARLKAKIEHSTAEREGIAEIDMLIENTLKNRIKIPEISEVKNYLYNFPELIEILPSICKVTRDEFPSDRAQLSLELDRDIEGQDEQLVLFVRQDHYEENILEIIDEIRSKYGDSLVGKKAWFIVMTDFASPEK